MEAVEISKIDDILDNRLKNSKLFHQILEPLDVDDKNIFLSYYLDFSSGIEFLVRQILIRKYDSDNFAIEKIQIKDEKSPKFYDTKEIKKLVENDFVEFKWIEFKNYCKGTCYDMKDNDFPNKSNECLVDLDDFIQSYGSARTIRNAIAHGFELNNVKFNKSKLIDFCKSYFSLHKILESLNKVDK